MAVHVLYKSLYISLPSSAQQQQRPSSGYFAERERRRPIFRIFIWIWTLALHI